MLKPETADHLKQHFTKMQQLLSSWGQFNLLQEEGPVKCLDKMISSKPAGFPEGDVICDDCLANREEAERIIAGVLGMM